MRMGEVEQQREGARRRYRKRARPALRREGAEAGEKTGFASCACIRLSIDGIAPSLDAVIENLRGH